MKTGYRRTFHPRVFLFFEAVALAAGTLSALLSGLLPSGRTYSTLTLPPLAAPPAVMAAVWIALLLMSGAAAYIVWNAYDIDSSRMLRLFLLQLAAGALWPVFLLLAKWYLFAFFWLLLALALTTLTMTGFKHIRRTAWRLMIPYLAALLYGAYLNLGIHLFNG